MDRKINISPNDRQLPVRVLSVAGGKDDAGNTNAATNIAVALTNRNRPAMLMDADLALATVNTVSGLQTLHNSSQLPAYIYPACDAIARNLVSDNDNLREAARSRRPDVSGFSFRRSACVFSELAASIDCWSLASISGERVKWFSERMAGADARSVS